MPFLADIVLENLATQNNNLKSCVNYFY